MTFPKLRSRNATNSGTPLETCVQAQGMHFEGDRNLVDG